MNDQTRPTGAAAETGILPLHRDLYVGGQWMPPRDGRYGEVTNPGTGESLGRVAEASAADVEAAIETAGKAFRDWREVPPLERARLLRRIAEILRKHDAELALIDATDCGNPVSAMTRDVRMAAEQLDFFAGLVTEMKGSSIPMGPDTVNFSVREPLGVVGRIIPFNHPVMFAAAKTAAPLAAGNTVIVKPPEQAPLSALRLAELIDGILPPGVFNVVPGGGEAGTTLASHPGVAKVALIGSVPTGRAVMRAASDTLKPVMLELGGKNALIAFPDADPAKVADGLIKGMNFAWCGQSCGSTSRAFLHEDIHDAVMEKLIARCMAIKPGIPTDPATEMGAIISKAQYDRILDFIGKGKAEGARLVCGGRRPDDPNLENGFFIEPTVFADVEPGMTIARQEIFGPVLSVFRWRDQAEMLEEVNAVEYGLTCSIWTRDLDCAHHVARAVEAGYVWINTSSAHFLGAPFGGYKQSGLGREECLDELLSFTQEKNINISLG